jgi:alkaline phosphatase D
VQSGDATSSSAVVWAKATGEDAERGGRLVVDVTRVDDPGFVRARRVMGPRATPATDLTAQLVVEGLPAGAPLLYRAGFVRAGLGEPSPESMTMGRTRTAATDDRELRFVWSGDTVGQGWGIDPERGGLAAYGAMRALAPDFFVHVGDMIYADSPLVAEVPLDDGTVWRNLVTPAKQRVAETLDDFRGCFAYPFLCSEFQRFAREVPLYAIWDDHEVFNDWWPGAVRSDPRATEQRADVLARHALRAMREYVPLRPSARLYRSVRWGAGAELFLLDGRSYRSPDGENLEPEGSAFWGEEQLAWLARGVTTSTATWKIIATDMPLALVLPHSAATEHTRATQEGFGQSDGAPLGRERELATLLSSCRAAGVHNLLFLTADVHYAAVHRFTPERAIFKDFNAFHECVAGPLHASSFPPKRTDGTFGPEVLFQVTEPVVSGSGPHHDRQSFGLVRVAPGSHALTVALRSGRGALLHEVALQPRGPR